MKRRGATDPVDVVAGCALNENLELRSVLCINREIVQWGVAVVSIAMAVVVWSHVLFWGSDCYSLYRSENEMGGYGTRSMSAAV